MFDETKKPVLQIESGLEEGNIILIRHKAANLLKQSFFTDQSGRIAEMLDRTDEAGSYEEALDIIGEYVTIERI